MNKKVNKIVLKTIISNKIYQIKMFRKNKMKHKIFNSNKIMTKI